MARQRAIVEEGPPGQQRQRAGRASGGRGCADAAELVQLGLSGRRERLDRLFDLLGRAQHLVAHALHLEQAAAQVRQLGLELLAGA